MSRTSRGGQTMGRYLAGIAVLVGVARGPADEAPARKYTGIEC
ncbi:MAG: hypothetical protein U0746_05065 [Gemmataceae bacterium]